MRFEGIFPHRTGWKSLGETVQGTGGVAIPGGAQTTRGWHLGTRSVVPVVVGPGGWLDSVASNDSVDLPAAPRGGFGASVRLGAGLIPRAVPGNAAGQKGRRQPWQ